MKYCQQHWSRGTDQQHVTTQLALAGTHSGRAAEEQQDTQNWILVLLVPLCSGCWGSQELVAVLPLSKTTSFPRGAEMSLVDGRPRSMRAERAANKRWLVERDGWQESTSRQPIGFSYIRPCRKSFITQKVRDPLLSLRSSWRWFRLTHEQDSSWNISHGRTATIL